MPFVALIFALAGMGLLTQRAHAYPQTIAQGYPSCRACHFNPYGGGPLTDYGRGLGAIEMAAKWTSPLTDDERISDHSGFLGPFGTLPPWFRMQAGYRGLSLSTGLESTRQSRWITMQADVSVILKDPEDHFYAVGNLGYVPPPAALPAAQQKTAETNISREHYLAYEFNDLFSLYAGFMDPAYGIRVVEHTAYIRTKSLLNSNDQTHGVMLRLMTKRIETSIHVMLGNLYQDSTLRLSGVTIPFEVETAENTRVGVSVFSGSNQYRKRVQGALYGRFGFSPDGSLLAQYGLQEDTPTALGASTRIGDSGFLQGSARFTRGVIGLLTVERARENFNVGSSTVWRAGPAIQIFPMNRVELRFDFLATHTNSPKTVAPDLYTLLGQLHVWL